MKEFKTILLGNKLIIYNYHKNLTCNFFNTDRVLIWRPIFEEYVPDIEYIKSENNIVADILSRIPFSGNQETTNERIIYRSQNKILIN